MRILTKVKHTCIQEDTVIFSTAARRKWMLNSPDGAKSLCQPHAQYDVALRGKGESNTATPTHTALLETTP